MKDSRMYMPLPDGLTVKDSSIHGLGLFSKTNFKAGTEFGITHIKADPEVFLQGVIRTPLVGFCNHSDTPNCYLVDKGDYTWMYVKTDLVAGEEITLDYRDNKCGQQYVDDMLDFK